MRVGDVYAVAGTGYRAGGGGTQALMVGLERTRIEDFNIDDALSIDDLTEEAIAAHLRLSARCSSAGSRRWS